ncbi:MAG TPA: tetratricopeptide repeat protein, partial [Steroidobacteraceae bacterium]|nr:tetratricopeptide repeat protein [Steroidobacteraceae bacterium]
DAAPNLIFASNRARMLYALGRYRESIDAFQDCLRRANGFLLGFCSIAVAGDYLELGDLESARRYIAAAEPIVKATSAPGSSVVLGFDVVRGKLAAIEHRYDDARRLLTNVIDAKKKNGATPTAFTIRAEVNMEDHRLDDAVADAHRAIELGKELQGGKPYSNRTGLAWLMLGRVLERQGNVPDARAALQSAQLHLSNTVDATHPALQQAQQLLLLLTPQTTRGT